VLVPFVVLAALTLGPAPAGADTHYVNKANGSAVSPFTNGWASAANSIQAAIDVSAAADLILVTNGVYDTGGRAYPGSLTNRVTIDVAVTVQAVSTNPSDTVIVGAPDMGGGSPSNGPGAVRCAYVGTGAKLIGFTLTNGYTRQVGGWNDGVGGGMYLVGIASNCVVVGCSCYQEGAGIWGYWNCGTAYNCQILANSCEASEGGACRANLYNCRIANNYAAGGAGAVGNCYAYGCLFESNSSSVSYAGACDNNNYPYVNCTFRGHRAGYAIFYGTPTLTNCLIVDNPGYPFYDGVIAVNCTIANNGGRGLYQGGALTNCIIWGNSPNLSSWYSYTLQNCCVDTNGYSNGTITGDHNITNNPLFVNATSGDYRLNKGSPCINTGTNMGWMLAGVDLDSKPRIQQGIVDMGAYEYSPPPRVGTVISIR
jgi:hypothetical protein